MFLNRLSNSKRETYKKCGFKYLLEYVDKVPDAGSNKDALNFGSFIHKIFEEGVKAKSVKELEDIGKRIRKDYPFNDSYNGKIITCLKNFLRFNSSLTETIAVEMNFTVPILEDLDYQVIIDRVVRAKTGEILIIDYKTSKEEKTKLELILDNQLRGYVYAIHKKLGVSINKIKACHYYPITDSLVPISYTDAQIRTYLKELERDIWSIRKAKKEDLVARENEFCNWCTKKYYCPIFCSPQDSKKRIDEARSAVRPDKTNNDQDEHNKGTASILPS